MDFKLKFQIEKILLDGKHIHISLLYHINKGCYYLTDGKTRPVLNSYFSLCQSPLSTEKYIGKSFLPGDIFDYCPPGNWQYVYRYIQEPEI